ncbi:hypothetical protein WSM22_13440 [Cytophagales bacterium WSM2-2]|nr:hypothetical protein WSM22_13440 [Cytophagales bacterium WSM2-2]
MSYIHTEKIHNFEAARIVVPFLMEIIAPKSLLDVGCGLGTWLKVFEEHGIIDILGLDGNYINKNQLKISLDKWKPVDLNQPFDLKRKFDLVICLEVVEHLTKSASDFIIDSLVCHSNTILFSAAIPGQGGQGHVNEQWLTYWQREFEKRGYKLCDILRSRFWNDSTIEVWYRQNMVIFYKENPILDDLRTKATVPVNLVHPELFSFYYGLSRRVEMFERGEVGISIAFKSLIRAIARKFK